MFICQSQWNDGLLLKLFPEYLKPIAAREREVEAARAKEKAELEAIKKAEAAKGLYFTWNMFCEYCFDSHQGQKNLFFSLGVHHFFSFI